MMNTTIAVLVSPKKANLDAKQVRTSTVVQSDQIHIFRQGSL